MKKCNYCDFEYESTNENKVEPSYLAHLNDTHIKCTCGVVFGIDEFEDKLSLCTACRELLVQGNHPQFPDWKWEK